MLKWFAIMGIGCSQEFETRGKLRFRLFFYGHISLWIPSNKRKQFASLQQRYTIGLLNCGIFNMVTETG